MNNPPMDKETKGSIKSRVKQMAWSWRPPVPSGCAPHRSAPALSFPPARSLPPLPAPTSQTGTPSFPPPSLPSGSLPPCSGCTCTVPWMILKVHCSVLCPGSFVQHHLLSNQSIPVDTKIPAAVPATVAIIVAVNQHQELLRYYGLLRYPVRIAMLHYSVPFENLR
jgi:hypothetical protein